ncbi:hypothetical protein [Cellulomonas sp. PhB150]|uniref:hypothetical protein n=1 Tax=Cellulomonas sp. PhB150 TaxID=2485188 RepID=UPI000F4AEB55|nr:hypothetical protein [Cellulomonas sp. PhB150]ROS28139.1 AraC-like DNA-binding protein [Cellulomonas sp. PhB150]
MPVDQVQYTRLALAVPGLVEHAWVVRDEDPTREILLPDGRGLLQVVLGDGGVLVDVTSGEERPDATGLRGLMTRPVVRVPSASAVRLGIQLHPAALAAVGSAGLVDAWGSVAPVLGEHALGTVEAALSSGDDERAARLVVDALRAAATEDADVLAFRETVRTVDDVEGAITVPELARAAEVTVSDVHRAFLRHLRVSPGSYLAAVRFSVFARRAVGAGPVRPEAVLRALRWYADAGYAPREVERTAGMSPVELRRVEERIAVLIGASGS